MPNNIAEIVLRVTTEGTQNAQALAGHLTQVDQAARQVGASALSAATAQRACTSEVSQTHSQMARLLQNWSDLQRQVDHFSATTLREFSATSARALTEWIEGAGNAREAFRGFATAVIEGVIQIMIQQAIAHALGLAQSREAAAQQSATNAEITASAAPAAAMQGAATFGANATGVVAVIAAVAAAIGILAAMKRAGGGPIYGWGSETSDSIPAWLSHGEYVHTAAAHRYYGTQAMDAINTRRIPVEAIHAAMSHRAFAIGGPVLAIPAFVGGGMVGGGDVTVGGVRVTNFNVIGDDEVERIFATTAAQRALDDHSARRTVTTSRLIHRSQGHRGEQ